jgi:phage terminase large subunit-like protein
VGLNRHLRCITLLGSVLQKLRPLADARCISAISNQLVRQGPPAWAWIYLGLRASVATLPGVVAYRLALDLNKIENKSTESQSMRSSAKKLWRYLPATLSTNYWLFCSFILVHGVSVYAVVRNTETIGQSWGTLKSEWGQSANAIITVCATCHVAYTLARLFTVESMRGRADDDWNNGLSNTWAVPEQPLLNSRPWNTLRQRWPFVMRLDFPDHLVVDVSTLQNVLKPLPEQNPKVREKLWEELMDGFTWNDTEGILDCLIQGAPTDRHNSTGDYPIHLASRINNTEILMLTHFKRQEDSKTVNNILFMNSASETPLEIACNANKLEAVRWIMEKMPQEQEEARSAVYRAFETAIVTENLDVLKILVHLWPDWRAFRMGIGSTEHSPFYYAVAMHKEKAADLLLDPKISQRENSQLWRSYELARRAALLDVIHYILHDDQDRLRVYATQDLTYDVLRCQLDGDEVWELLQAFGIDARDILFGAVDTERLRIRDSIPFHKPELWKHLVAEVSKYDIVLLDTLVLRFTSIADQIRISDTRRNEHDQVAKALIHYGALDWSKAMNASKSGEFDNLERLIKAESDSIRLGRMLSVQTELGWSILSHVVAWLGQSVSEDFIDIVGSLLQHGSPVMLRDIMNTYTRWPTKDSSFVIGLMLLAEQKKGVATNALHFLCKEQDEITLDWAEYLPHVHILLRSGADPTLKHEDGKTPREQLEVNFREYIEDPPRASYDDGETWQTAKYWLVLKRKSEEGLERISDLLRRWEDYYRDPSIGNPSEQPDEAWVAVHDRVVMIAGEHRWASMVEKNPGFRVIDTDTTREGIRRREIERREIERREIERREIERREIEEIWRRESDQT